MKSKDSMSSGGYYAIKHSIQMTIFYRLAQKEINFFNDPLENAKNFVNSILRSFVLNRFFFRTLSIASSPLEEDVNLNCVH